MIFHVQLQVVDHERRFFKNLDVLLVVVIVVVVLLLRYLDLFTEYNIILAGLVMKLPI